MTNLQVNKELVRRMFEEVYNKGNYDFADEVFAENYISHNKLNIQVLGPDGIKKTAREQRAAFPDLRSELLDVIAEEDKVVVRGMDTGTHRGVFAGKAPTGKRFQITWIDIFRLENGKLAEAWLEIDAADFMKQLSEGEKEEA